MHAQTCTVLHVSREQTKITRTRRWIIVTQMASSCPPNVEFYAYEGDYQLVKEPLHVKIDMGEINVS
jgi:hypothetical protein